MRVTVIGKDANGKRKKINFLIKDHFTEKAIRKETNKLIRERCPEIHKKPFELTWKY